MNSGIALLFPIYVYIYIYIYIYRENFYHKQSGNASNFLSINAGF